MTASSPLVRARGRHGVKADVRRTAAAMTTGRERYPKYDILVTLCRFDDKLARGSNSGPFIPCQRRLAKTEILEIQGRGFRSPF